MKLNFDIDNKALKNQLESYARNVPNEVKGVVAESALVIEGQAQSLAPVGHYPNSKRKGGNLKNSIKATFYNGGASAEIGTPVHYAPYVEFGTYKMSAQPYMFPAFERERPKYLRALEKAVSKT